MSDFFVVTIDFDGVLAQGLEAKLKYAKKWFGVDLDLSQTKKEGFEALMKKLGKSVSYRSLMDRLNEEHMMEYQTPADCIDVLSQLFSAGYRFAVVTSRNEHDFPYAVQFIKQTFGNLVEYVHATGTDDKGKFISRIKPRVHIDDDLKKLMLLAEYPVELIYYRQPENQSIEIPLGFNDRINEVESFEQVGFLLRRLRCLHETVAASNAIADNWVNVPKLFALVHSLTKEEQDEIESHCLI